MGRSGGPRTPIAAPVRNYIAPRISPDGTRIALDVRDQEQDIWIWDIPHAALVRFTFDPQFDQAPAWSADGRRLFFASRRNGNWNVFAQQADGTGSAEQITRGPGPVVPYAASPDNAELLVTTGTQTTGGGIGLVHLENAGTVETIVKSPRTDSNPDLSPDGRWLAYQSDESGQREVYVRPFPRVNDGRWQVSTGGGVKPAWARNGAELFYVDPVGALMSVSVRTQPTFAASAPVKVVDAKYFSGSAARNYDVSADGRRFLVIKNVEHATDSVLNVVVNWMDELKEHVGR